MNDLRLPSIPLESMDKENCYFNPGCAYQTYHPERAEALLRLLQAHYGPVKPHARCCHNDPGLAPGSVIINNCAGCDRRFRSLYPGVSTISLWEVLDSIQNLPLPRYSDLTLSVHDSCSYRPKPQVHAAVRGLLGKMGIAIVESDHAGTKSICCGDNFYPSLPVEKVRDFQKMRAAQMPCQDVAVYCVSCIKSMTVGGKTAHHMADLVLGLETEPQETDLKAYHDSLQSYIDSH